MASLALGDFPRGVVVTSYLDEHQERALSRVELKSNLDLYQQILRDINMYSFG